MKKTLSCLLVLLFICVCGCSAQESPNTYVEGSDFQYMEVGGGTLNAAVQQVGKDCYMICKGYLYYMDQATGTMLPLCNKADCLHDKEPPLPDTCLAAEGLDRLDKCNACVDIYAEINLGIAYSDGYLYCLNPSVLNKDSSSTPALFRCTMDGSKKEIVYRWDNNVTISSWLIHRGELYYIEETYILQENADVKKIYTLCALSLKGTMQSSKVIYTPDEALTVQNLDGIRAYGNHLYFNMIAYAPGDDVLSEENFMEYMHNKTFVYDTASQQLGEVRPEGMSKYESVQSIAFWQDQIVFNIHDFSDPGKETLTLYTAGLDGSNVRVLMENAPRQYACDGQYLYLNNLLAAYRKGENGIFWAYDSTMKLVDTFQLPYDSYGGYGRAIGGYPQAYVPIFLPWDAEQSWSLAHWDKSKIGTYNGEMIEVEYIVR